MCGHFFLSSFLFFVQGNNYLKCSAVTRKIRVDLHFFLKVHKLVILCKLLSLCLLTQKLKGGMTAKNCGKAEFISHQMATETFGHFSEISSEWSASTKVDNNLPMKKKDQDSDQKNQSEGIKRPTLSYIALISMAIMSAPEQKMILSEIYDWIATKYPYYKHKDRSWRNSIRHNLSLNECFVKAGKSENGKGNYWTIHPANTSDFSQGDFRRRHARRRVRHCNEELERLRSRLLGIPDSSPSNNASDLQTPENHYVPMTSIWAPKSALSAMFGPDVVLTPEEINCMKGKRHDGNSTENRSSLKVQGETSCIVQPNNYIAAPPAPNAVGTQENAHFMGERFQSTQLQHQAQTVNSSSNVRSAPSAPFTNM